MADLYIGINKGVNISGTGSENGPIISSGSISSDVLLKLVGTAFTTAATRDDALKAFKLIEMTLLQTGSWPLS
jgi:hypothetical protein